MAERRPGHPAPPIDRTVSGDDLYAEDLTGRAENRVRYVDVDLTESTSTSGATFVECDFRNVNFNASVHTGAAFINCTFATCNFFDARFVDCKMVGSTFDRCKFDRLTVEGGDWSFVGLPGADLRSASFTGARMREADLTGANAAGVTIRTTDLSGSSSAKASFEGADLRGSDLTGLDPGQTVMRGAIVDWNQAIAIASTLGLDVRPE